MENNIQILWFKRDLRIDDNVALTNIDFNKPILLLYIIEPKLWQQPDLSYRQYMFLKQALSDLKKQLKMHNLQLVIKVGDTVEILKNIHKKYNINSIFSHQETWNGWTYARDQKVKKWTKINNILWHEYQQNGVKRCLKNRNGWSYLWYDFMKKPILKLEKKISCIKDTSDEIPKAENLGLDYDGYQNIQQATRENALQLLRSFLNVRGKYYSKQMSSPVYADQSCSRLSSYIAFGLISIREVFQSCEAKILELKNSNFEYKSTWIRSLRSFSSRLRWHCHFIQKLEDQPNIEYHNMHSAYDNLRRDSFNEEYFNAWKNGETGYPMIDACMKCLISTGWINFRMRAMLMSFASYHLWLHWKKPALYLAQLFVDYEPGIHYSQTQMQSGTTGINAIRIYNPTKQAQDHDPNGIFIKKWIPQLKEMPTEYIHKPWEFPSLLNGYNYPIIDEKKARNYAKEQIYSIRKNLMHSEESKQIVVKHASRKNNKAKKKKETKNPNQYELPF